MAIRVRAMLRKWFGRGMYPTAEQFSDLFDSFWHKTEDKIPINSVGGLPEQLNGKYSAADGKRLEERVTRDEKNLSDYIEQTDEAIDQLREEDAAIRRDFAAADSATLVSAKGYTDIREGVIRTDMATGDAATLQSAKTYTDGRETEIRKDMTAGDATTLAQAEAFTTEREGVLRGEQQDGDAATLASANEYTDGRETLIRGEMAAGDAATLQSAKEHAAARETAIRKDMTDGDASTLSLAEAFATERESVLRKEQQDGDTATLNAAKGHTNERETAVRKEFAAADASTLQAAKDHTAARETAIRSDMTSGDASTLASAKEYVDKAVEQILSGSPEALDTLKELADALGNDPNFAATVTKQLGQKVDKVTGKGLSTEDYTTAEKQKLAGIAAGANNYQHPATHPASMVQQDTTHQFITEEERRTWNSKPGSGTATGTSSGLMSAADKQKLDGVAAGANNYQHPASHPASMVQQDSTHRFVTDTEKSAWSGKASTSVATQAANGLMSAADKKALDELLNGEFIIQCTIPGIE